MGSAEEMSTIWPCSKAHIMVRRGRLPIPITKEELAEKYISGQSLGDIACHYNCTRQYVHKLVRKFGLSVRTRQEARNLAVEQGKIVYTSDTGKKIVQIKRYVNRAFFKSWSPAMAYVLGVIYTDGCLARPNSRTGVCLTIGQKEPELLEKVLALLSSNAKVTFRKKKGIRGALYTFVITDAEIYGDLVRLGLTPRKSLTITFPEIPLPYIRHFIRGCWDGDGSVYWETKTQRPGASFGGGSRPFIEELARQLVTLGLPGRTIYARKVKNTYYDFRFTGGDCALLYHVLYDGVDEKMYLTRKQERFKKIAEYCELFPVQPRRRQRLRSNKTLLEEIKSASELLRNELQGRKGWRA